MRPHRPHHRRLVSTVVFTSTLLGLIALALGNTAPVIAIVALFSVVVLAAIFHFTLPHSDFFSAVFANSIGAYACIFVFFVSQNFARANGGAQAIAFVLPLVGFVIGLLWHLREITAAVSEGRDRAPRQGRHPFIWLPPLVAVGAASFLLPLRDLTEAEQGFWLLGAMTVLSLTGFLAARDITAFLLETAVLFGDFFENAAKLAKPAFAFFTCYSLLALVFGCLFTILDRYSPAPNFLVGGTLKAISLGEGIYLSVVTLSTVGYGDLIAQTPIARIFVAFEIFSGVLLLLFGVQAILSARQE